MDSKRIARRFLEAGGVVKMTPKPKVPTLTIRGRKYALSDYWPMGTGMADDMAPEQGGGAKRIDTGGNKYRYLWVYDTDRGRLAMWRHSDGDEKLNDRASSLTHHIYALEKRGQLNRVTREEHVEVERYMHGRYEDTFKSLKEYLKENETNWDKQCRDVLDDWFAKNVEPIVKRRLAELKTGVIPFGFKVNDRILEHKSAEEQAQTYIVTDSMKGFTQEQAYRIVSEAVGYDAYEPPHGGDPQSVYWAWSDLVGEVYDRYQ